VLTWPLRCAREVNLLSSEEGESSLGRSGLGWAEQAGFAQTNCGTLRNEVESLNINTTSHKPLQLALTGSTLLKSFLLQ
jgi:hypothetical protein